MNRDRTRLSVIALMLATTLSVPLAQAGMMEKEGGMTPHTGMMTEEHMMGRGMTGTLMGAKDHHASGTVAIVTGKDGRATLLLENVKVDKVPDGRVYLAKNGDHTKGVELGKLTQFAGSVQYAVPANVNHADYDSVVIWCKKFSVEIGRAMLDSSTMAK